jgi:hypothetical protein
VTGGDTATLEALSYEQLLAWVGEASAEPRPCVLIYRNPKTKIRLGLLYESERAGRERAMAFQCFDPDLFEFESIEPATPKDISRGQNQKGVVFKERADAKPPRSSAATIAINLSCGSCKAIRAFSGQPPKCVTCGWTLGDLIEFTDTPYWQGLRKQRQGPLANDGVEGHRRLRAGKRKSEAAERLSETVRGILAVAMVTLVVALGVGLLSVWMTPEADQLAERYQLSKDRVFVQTKPHGCEYNDSPLGEKHCHYEKTVDVSRECPADNCRVTGVHVSWRRVEE